MAKQNANHVTPDVAEDPKPAAAAETPKLTSEQLKVLGANFLKGQAATEAAETAYEKARAVRSDAIKAIVEAFGHKGPFSIGGKLWNATLRKSSGFYSMSEQSGAKADLG